MIRVPKGMTQAQAANWNAAHRQELEAALIAVAHGKPNPVGFLVRQFTDDELIWLLRQQEALGEEE